MLYEFLLHIGNPLIHGHSTAWRTAFPIIVLSITQILDTHLRFTYHCYTCMYSCFTLVIWIPVHITCMIVPCYRIHVIWLFPVTDMDIPDTGHESCWYAICGILFPLYCSCYIVPVSRYIVLCYQQSSGPVIMLPVSCTVLVLVTLYTWHIRS